MPNDKLTLSGGAPPGDGKPPAANRGHKAAKILAYNYCGSIESASRFSGRVSRQSETAIIHGRSNVNGYRL